MLGGGLTLLLGFQVWLKSVGACQVDKGWTVVALQHVNMTRLFFSHNSLPSVFTIRVERKRYFVQGLEGKSDGATTYALDIFVACMCFCWSACSSHWNGAQLSLQLLHPALGLPGAPPRPDPGMHFSSVRQSATVLSVWFSC